MRVLFDVDAFIPRRLLGLLLVAAERFLGEDRVAGEVDARYLAMNQRIKELEERVATLIEVVGARARREG